MLQGIDERIIRKLSEAQQQSLGVHAALVNKIEAVARELERVDVYEQSARTLSLEAERDRVAISACGRLSKS